ncbi:MAG TPA: hypothetical protein DCL80_12655 [Balneola sp.]|jgi:nucleoid DNA-binding protein|nr:hypothetical protein [Balneola sp.]MAO76315.1 hypothetical protein [Balneola sp.]MBF65506.1 hypothetical protein [Balneola sp.]HAH52047.1 hypothetical protein [Balneola sp.]HAW82047.1 hypothetical protein [Balneola sp.]|tara:strand:- start:1327 stop:2433 length:1107 start_codon:yes stop_codon:yes gene_type:complete
MSTKITFSELVKAFAETHDLTQQKAEDLIRGIFDLVVDDLEDNGKASITNFGSFELKEVAERTGINPQTKEEIIIPAHNKVSFKPFKALESKVNAPYADLEPRLLGDSPKAEETTVKAEPESVEKEFEDPFEAVIDPEKSSGEKEELEGEEETEKETPTPVYKASEKEEKSNTGWLFIILILLLAATGIWFFFFRESGSSSYNEMAADNEPTTQEQVEQPERTPPDPEVNEPMQPEQKETVSSPDESAAVKEEATATRTTPKAMTTYIIEKDEWLWDISREVYGEPYLWPLIFEANKTVNDNPNLVEPSNTLMIPVLVGDSSNLTKEDYSTLAKATKLVSEAYAKAGNSERAKEYARFAAKYERHSKN